MDINTALSKSAAFSLSIQADAIEKAVLTMDFEDRRGLIHGFPYGHLISFSHEPNPDASAQPNAPTDRFVFCFSTHDVLLTGWRLGKIIPAIRHGKLMSVKALDPRYLGIPRAKPHHTS